MNDVYVYVYVYVYIYDALKNAISSVESVETIESVGRSLTVAAKFTVIEEKNSNEIQI